MDLKLDLQKLETPEDIQKLVSAISEMADSLDVLVSTIAPNGNISGRAGQLCLYNNSGTYTLWVNSTGSTVWQQVGANDMSYADTRLYTGSFSWDLSTTGTQAITGVGFTPKAIFLMAAFPTASATYAFSMGLWDGTTQERIFAPAVATTGIFASDAVTQVLIGKIDGSNYAEMAMTSFDSNGFTVTKTKTGLPTGTMLVNFIVFR